MANKVLLADDSVTIQKIVDIILRGEGFLVQAVNTGEDALAALAEERPDIVLADINMPGISGYQLIEEMQKNPETRGIPALLLAGAFETVDRDLVAKSKAAGLIIKPFESRELIDRINGLLSPVAIEPKAARAEEELFDLNLDEEVEAEVIAETSDEEASAIAALTAVIEDDEPVAETAFALEPEGSIGMTEDAALVGGEDQSVEVIEVSDAYDHMPAVSISSADIEAAVKKAVDEKFATIDIQAIITSAIASMLNTSMKESTVKEFLTDTVGPVVHETVEKILWEVTPEVTENVLRSAIKDTLTGLKKEVENVIWETVPEIAETIIKQEIEQIKRGL